MIKTLTRHFRLFGSRCLLEDEAPDEGSSMGEGQLAAALVLHFLKMPNPTLRSTVSHYLGLFFIPQFQFFSAVSLLTLSSVENLRTSLPGGQTDTDGSSKSHPASGWRANKNASFPDQQELQNILQKLSRQSLEATTPGDTDSLSSYTSGW